RVAEVVEGPGLLAQDVEVDPQVEMGIEPSLLALIGSDLPRLRRGEHLLGLALPLEQVVDEHHGHAVVLADFEELLPGLLDPRGAGVADEVPDGILHIVSIDLLVAGELLLAFLEAAEVVEGDATLPVAVAVFRTQLQETIEVLDRLLDLPSFELLA